jgi:hypothetical protein
MVVYGWRTLDFAFHPVPSMGGSRELFPPDFGFELCFVYLMWALIVLLVYPACRWFAG